MSGDDLGLSPSVDEGLLSALEAGGLRSVSVLATGATSDRALSALCRRARAADVGVHLDLAQGSSLVRFALRGPTAAELTRRVRAQVAALRAAGLEPTHVDAHRHAYCLPWVRRRVCALAARADIGAVRSLRPRGPLFAEGPLEALKRVVLVASSIAAAGSDRAWGLAVPDGFVSAAEAAGWVRAGRIPSYARGRTLEVIAHPAIGPEDVPAGEAGVVDRAADARHLLRPPLAAALAGLGAQIVDFRGLSRGEEDGWNSRNSRPGSSS